MKFKKKRNSSDQNNTINEVIASKPLFIIRWGMFILLVIFVLIIIGSANVSIPILIIPETEIKVHIQTDNSDNLLAIMQFAVPNDKISVLTKRKNKICFEIYNYSDNNIWKITGNIENTQLMRNDSILQLQMNLKEVLKRDEQALYTEPVELFGKSKIYSFDESLYCKILKNFKMIP